MVVLEDETSSKRVPAVSGLLAYRKDIQSLHIRMNDSWKALPVEEEVRQKRTTTTCFIQRESSGGRQILFCTAHAYFHACIQ